MLPEKRIREPEVLRTCDMWCSEGTVASETGL
jgi:hypothetical protein